MRGRPFTINFCLLWLPIIHICLSTLPSCLIYFVLNYAAYFAEIFRGGFQSIDQGQFERHEFALESLADNDQDRYLGDQNRVAINR